MNNDVELIPVKGVLPSVQVQSDNVIYVPQAHKNKAGIVKEGDGVLIENGVVSLNRQTVEDMIDANKWVSYGFEQNLTEDEKGMARHNIGAGDNYFTGSWYDLANRPQETVDFAESERQKSKNLFPYSTITGTDFYQQHLNTPIKAGTYTISALVSSSDTDSDLSSIVFENEDKSYIITVDLSRNSRSSATFTINQDCSYVTFFASYQYTVSVGDTFTFSNIQIEEGSVATSYQPYNGAITHNGDAPVVFAESERQKSKNLFNINNGIYKGALTTSGGLATASNVSFSIDNETITLTTDTYDWRGIHSEYFKLKGNTVYTLSYSRSDVVAFLVCFYDSSYTFINSVYEQGNTQKTFTVPTNTAYVRFGIQNISVGTVTISNIQIEEGSVATDYQPYNGQITHNGDAPVTFAESERQKSKNLCCLKNESATVAGVTMIYDSINQTIELNGTSTGDINIMPNIRNILPIISNSLGKTYSFTILIESGNFSNNFGVYLGSLDSDIWSDRFTIWVNKGITVSSLTFTVSTNHTYDTLFVYLLKGTVVNNLKLKVQIEEGSVATDYQPYNGAIVHEKEIEITIGDATLNTDVVSSGEVSWVKQGKLVVVSFSDIKFKSPIAHQNLYFSGLPKKAIKAQTFLLHQMNALGGSSIRCMMQKDSTQIVNWYQDTDLDTNAQYYGQLTYITDEN